MDRAQEIKEKALELGFSKCGIINVDAVKGFKERLDARTSQFPQSALMYYQFAYFSDVKSKMPWCESLVVCVFDYWKYNVPEGIEGRIGKAYAFDGRKDERSDAYKAKEKLIEHMKKMGIRAECGGEHGITSFRYAAEKAGLGKLRKNNFFYTENGSWNAIDVIAINKKLELKEKNNVKDCPDGCSKCAAACPTGALKGPYSMHPMRCVSFVTSIGGGMFPLTEDIGNWVYGCDACQDACPFDQRDFGGKDFPGLKELSENLTLEKIIDWSDEYYEKVVQPKFWYLGPDKLWVWKLNALNAMKNGYREKYKPFIKKCLDDKNDRVSGMAQWICETLKL